MHDQTTNGEKDSLREELDRMRERANATREILEVISQSRADEVPVFDAILANAQRLCGAPFGFLSMLTEDGENLEILADGIEPFEPFRPGWRWHINSVLLIARSVREKATLQIEDTMLDPLYAQGNKDRVTVVKAGIRTVLTIPLIIDGLGIGSIALFRREQRPFTSGEIALVQTFAEQAVIAIENVRQFRELQTRLEHEAATGEVLSVISQFRNDEAPVFEAILENAAHLCRAPHAFLQLRNEAGTHLEVVGQNFAKSKMFDLLRADPTPLNNNEGSISVRTMNAAIPSQCEDLRLLKGTDSYTSQVNYAVETEGIRTLLLVPLIADGKSIGVIMLYKQEVAPFKDNEISLVQTFAAQAVIAIENVRQFRALEQLNAELGDRVKEQVGEIERMDRLKRFLPPAVADTVVSLGSEKMLKSHRALLGVLFCDIRGFTAFCETAEPEETIEVLQTYHEEMGKLINAHGAGVDHRMGDGIMVLFNDPLPCDDPAGQAVRLAIAMRERMAVLCVKWKKLGHRLGFGIGVSLGYATVGMVGFEGRYDYTASGTAINLAARLCDKALDGEILLSPRARNAVEDDFQVESRGEISLKGIREPVEVFSVADTSQQIGK